LSASGCGRLDYADKRENEANNDDEADNVDNGIHLSSPGSRDTRISKIKFPGEKFRPARRMRRPGFHHVKIAIRMMMGIGTPTAQSKSDLIGNSSS
jgi:hypothetical protein